ncbi:response regulator transcription factor [Tabrizicola sp.]|uniref:response regulator transcription factor n=1 Tax=Tabrizicola sp. TaxID=2005166 RepID=UPI003F31C981
MLPAAAPIRHLNSALIVDDHPLFCDALAMTLKSVAGIQEIETADRLETAIQRVDQRPLPDAVVLDLNLPDVNGIDGLIRLRQAAADVPVLVVSSLADNRVIGACLAAGAAGFVPKHSRREVFRAAFEALREGRRVLPEGYDPAPDARVRSSVREEAIARLALLTRQQAKILQLICDGLLNKQIAYELSIAETTVKAHVTAIMRKLKAQNRTQAVLAAGQTSFTSLMPEDR